ncbi:MAG: YCF48-related protein [Planctomycetota bacterium]
MLRLPYFCCLAAGAALFAADADAQRSNRRTGNAGAVAGPTLDAVMGRDAALHDLAFVDTRHGWAVGDRGVVLRTTDGGRRWRRMPTPVDCPLYSVAFINPRQGWAVGGYTGPYSHSTRGVVLQTEDGGDTWRRLPADTLPLLRHVQFFDERTGVAAGAGSPLMPSGVLATEDGGRTWRPLMSDRPARWAAACFARSAGGPAVGAAVGQAGAMASIAGHRVQHTTTLRGDARGVNAVALGNDHRTVGRDSSAPSGWAVGDGGLILATGDAGRSWRPPTTAPPAATARAGWRGVAVDGPRVWVAGQPGSVILHSPDGGRSWRLQPTGVVAPLHAVTFVDAVHGWAAGTLGTILATSDGGQTWRVQRGAGTRVAVAVFAAHLQDTPVELIAGLAAADGYLTSVDVVFAPGNAEEQAATHARLTEAATASGATLTGSGWQLTSVGGKPAAAGQPGMPAGQLRRTHNLQTGGHGERTLRRQLVTRLRTLRPDLVIVPVADIDQPTGAQSLLLAALGDVLRASADPGAMPELATLGLAPWRVRRLVAAGPDARGSSPRLATGDFSPLLGTSPAGWVGATRGLLSAQYRPTPDAYAWRTLVDNRAATGHSASAATGAATGKHPMAGIALPRGGDARRRPATPPPGKLATLRAAVQKRRVMERLRQHTQSDEAWIAQAAGLTSGLGAYTDADTGADTGAGLLYQLADAYRRDGKPAMAADTLYLLARRYRDHPLAEPAVLWLLRYYASSEVAHAARRVRAPLDPPPLANVTGRPAPQATPDFGGTLTLAERLERAIQLGDYLEKARPALYADPAVRFPIAAAHRTLEAAAEAPPDAPPPARQASSASPTQRLTAVFTKQAVAPAWRGCALAEQWLAGQHRLAAAKPSVACVRTTDRPLLDGVFDEQLWRGAEPIALVPAPQAYAADQQSAAPAAQPGGPVVRLASDAEFLYVAIDCPAEAGAADTAGTEADHAPRPRDGDLSRHARVTLRLDTDRDYTTAFELSIDRRGWTNDRCWGDRHWDPRWYVATGSKAGQQPGRWTAEAAIPLAELTPSVPRPGAAWAVSVQHHSPRDGGAAWPPPTPAGSAQTGSPAPASYGLLLFP